MRLPWLITPLVVACSGKGGDSGSETYIPPGGCTLDEDGPTSPAPLGINEDTEGTICPVADQDWFAVTIPSGTDLLTVSLDVGTEVTAVDLTYTLYDDAAESVLANAAAGEAATPGAPLAVTHGVPGGSYLLLLRDIGDDGEDARHPYTVRLGTGADPDANEPNNAPAQATAKGTAIEGYIAYRADEDWYSFSSPVRGLVRVQLQMPAGGIEPSFRVVDAAGEDVATQSNPAGTRQSTALDYFAALDEAGTYHVVVHDDDGLDWDGDTPYTLSIEVSDDPDTNEPNDGPVQATPLGAHACGGSWSSAAEQGYIAATGDSDWYQVDLSGCSEGLLRAELGFNGTVPESFHGNVRVLRSAPGTSCSVDTDCAQLSGYTCETDLDCAGFGNECLGSGFCAGGSACLESGQCTARILSEVAPDSDPGTLDFIAPVRGLTEAWVVVSDYLNDTNSPATSYDLNVSIQADPDDTEPNDVYTGGPPEVEDKKWELDVEAVDIPVYDNDLGQSCATGAWTTGAIAYTYDQDWFQIAHPCPDADCMIRIWYDVDGGEVDHWLRMYSGTSPWFDPLFQADTGGTQSAASGSFGGLSSSDECVFAARYHGSSEYQFRVRDSILDASQDPTGTWDASPGQVYSFCVEKIASGCLSPCFLNTYGKETFCSTYED